MNVVNLHRIPLISYHLNYSKIMELIGITKTSILAMNYLYVRIYSLYICSIIIVLYGHTATCIENKIYVFGGCIGTKTTNELYILQKCRMYPKSNLPHSFSLAGSFPHIQKLQPLLEDNIYT